MKFRITMKDPDGVSDGITEAVESSLVGLKLTSDELKHLQELRQEEITDRLEKWFEYGEYLEVEIDLDAGTATVVENK